MSTMTAKPSRPWPRSVVAVAKTVTGTPALIQRMTQVWQSALGGRDRGRG